MAENDRVLDEGMVAALADEDDPAQRFRLLTDVLTHTMPQMVWATDADGRHFFYNSRWYEYTGLSVEDCMGYGFANALHPDDKERTLARWKRAWAQGADYEIEYRFVRHDGEARWFVGRAQPVRSRATGEVVMWVGTCTDIHDQKLTEARLKAALERETIRNRIADELRRAGTPEAVLESACREIAATLQCSRARYSETDLDRGTVTIRVEHRTAPTALPSQLGVYALDLFGEPIMGELRSGRTVAVADCLSDPRTAPFAGASYDALGTAAFVAVPILRGGRWVATLSADQVGAPREWGAEDVALLEAVAGQTQAVMELAQETTRERRTAQAFQDTVSPPARPQIGPYRFASHYAAALEESAIGGDFYDQFALPGGRVGVVIGDVSGKGLAAAVQTAQVKFTLRGFASDGASSPGAALTRLNQSLENQDALTGFVTLFYALLDPEAGMLTWAAAGHEPALLCEGGKPGHRELGPTGPVLGVAPDAEYGEGRCSFRGGDRLLLYTDGLTEARARRGPGGGGIELMGVERVAEILCDGANKEMPEAALARLLRRTAEFTGVGFRDDLALLLVDCSGAKK